MLKQGPEFHFEISEVEITRVDCITYMPTVQTVYTSFNFMDWHNTFTKITYILQWERCTSISKTIRDIASFLSHAKLQIYKTIV